MRATLLLLALLFGLLAGGARAQAPLELGSPEQAFAGGPINLSRTVAARLRTHYQGDKVPLVPKPFRANLDSALQGRDWPRVQAVKRELVASHGFEAALAWEQSRFIATGSIGVAEMHALDVAATGSSGLSETAVMVWFYAVAVTLTDGHKCVDEAVKEAHLDRLRGPGFDPVTRIVRSMSEDRVAAMRDLAIRLETVLAPDRTDDTMCREGGGRADVKPDATWRPEAAMTRGMLPRHLMALASVMRPRPVGRPEGQPVGRPDGRMEAHPVGRMERTKIGPAATDRPAGIEPLKAEAEKPEPTTPPKPAAMEARPAAPEPARATVTAPRVEQPDPVASPKPAAVESQPAAPEAVRTTVTAPPMEQPNPARFGPRNLELAVPDQRKP